MTRVQINNLGIPPLAGLCSYEDACKAGYPVERSVELLKRYNYVESQLNAIFAAHIPDTPEWEVKCGISLHTWLDAEHAAALRKRVAEMREPPLHLDQVPDERLRLLLDEVIRATNTVELLVGIYRVIKTELVRSLKKHLGETNPLFDHPTCRVLKFILQEEEEMVAWGEQAISALTQTSEDALIAEQWAAHLQIYLQNAGGIFGDMAPPEPAVLPSPRSDGHPYKMNPVPRRDRRITNSFDQSHWKYIDGNLNEKLDPDERAFALIYRRLREMDVPEWMAPIIYQTKGKPWAYYVDMSRQLWDEARHAMMGEVGLYANGMAFYEYPIELEGSMSLNTRFSPLEAHILLWNVEQGLMKRETGKRFEVVTAESTGDSLVMNFQDYDWADEVLHAQIGRRWLRPEFESYAEMQAKGQGLMAKWYEEMNKLIPPEPHQEWWPQFVADLRQRREQLGVDVISHS